LNIVWGIRVTGILGGKKAEQLAASRKKMTKSDFQLITCRCVPNVWTVIVGFINV
jgi:hypothetical protein